VKVPRTCRKARFYYPRLLNYERGELWVDDVFFVPYNSIPADMRTSETLHAISPADAKRINDLYDGSVRYVDTRVGELVKLLESRGFLQQGAFAITADHGQDLMDHRWLGHGEGFSWDSILRVPFIVYAPSLTKTPERVSKLCESVDIAPTLLTLIGIDPPRFFQGANILSSKHKKDYVFANYRKLYTIVTPDHRFRYDAERGKAELNILANDPKQRVNVAGKNPDLVREYRQLLDELVKKFTLNLKAQPATKQMSPEVRDRLKDLGYL
jgi:arylsulfatase A-like enzyme